MNQGLKNFLCRFALPLLILTALTAVFPSQEMEKLESRLPQTKGEERLALLEELTEAYKTNSPQKAFSYGTEAMEQLNTLPQPDRKRELSLLTTLSFICSQLGKYEAAKEFAEKGISISQQTGDEAGLADSLFSLGEAYRGMGLYEQALENYVKCEPLYRNLKNRKKESRVYNSIGLTYFELSDYPQVLEYYLKAKKISEELGDRAGTASNNLNIGRVYWRLNEYDNALEYYSNAKKLYEEEKDLKGVGAVLNNIATVYSSQKKYDESLKYLEESLEIKQQVGLKPAIASTLNNIGDNYENKGDLQRARDYYNRSLTIWEEVNNKLGIAVGLLNLGSIDRKLGRYDDALRNFNRSLDISMEINAKEITGYTYDNLSLAYADMGNYRKALELHIKKKELSDSIFNEQNSKKIADIRKNYEIVKNEKEIALLKKDAEIRQLALERQRNLKNYIIIVSLLILLLAFVVFTRYRLKVRVTRELQKQVEERKLAEAELLKSRKLESLGILAGGIAHDFNNLLAVIMGNIALAKDCLHDPRIKPEELLEKAQRASNQAAHLANEFITLSNGGWSIQKELTLSQVLKNAADFSPKVKDIHYTVSIPPDLPPFWGDDHQLQQVFVNMLVNADEAVAEKEKNITVAAEKVSLDKNNPWALVQGDYLKISVTDNGKGIPSHLLEKIFDPYFSTKDRGNRKGMGLGLAICFSIVKKHRGYISVMSQPGEGTTFDIYLPVFRETPSPVGESTT